MKLLRYNISPEFVNLFGIPTVYAAIDLFQRRPDDEFIKVKTCSLLLNKLRVLTY